MFEKLKQHNAQEKEKLKNMNLKEKIEYIGEYYRTFIIFGVIIVIIGGSIINNVFINPPPVPFSTLAFIDCYVINPQSDEIAARLTDYLIPEPEMQKKLKVMGYTFIYGGEDPQMDMATQQRLLSMLTAKELDVIFTSEGNFFGLMNDDYFLSLKGLDIDVPEDKLVGGVTEARLEESIYGISMKGNTLLEECGINTEGLYMGIVVNTLLQDNAVQTINEILKYSK